MFENFNAVGYFEYTCGFTADQGINERESVFFPVLVFESDRSISYHFCLLLKCSGKLIQKLQITGALICKIIENNWVYELIECIFNKHITTFKLVFRNMVHFFYLQTTPNEFIEISEYLFTLGTLITFMKINVHVGKIQHLWTSLHTFF